ncbi:MAG TPA: pyridoxal-dependent decarboxylase [Bryobacteraceae bacterium]|nr:pyridoxal-dependent decarboxylase [Bryobacteraceae bacterium]
MSPEEFRAAAHEAVDWIAAYLRDARQYPVLPPIEPGQLIDRLPQSGPEQGEPIEAILRDFRELIVPATTHWNHPRFLAYFANSASGPGILGEMLCAALNSNHMIWKTGPAAAELEQVALGWLRQWLALPEEFFGTIHDTASTATMHAIMAAREAAAPQIRIAGEHPPLVLYASEHANFSVDRAALVAGIGLNHIRHVAADQEFRMRPEALEAAILSDLAAGNQPFCVVPTLGTTSSASLDPLPEIAPIARRYRLWLHVDAAYAGPAAMLQEYKHILNGAETADSLVVNPHKWLFTPLDLSILYTRRPEVFRRALSLERTPAYIGAAGLGRAVNFSEYSLSLGRRFRALKLWFVLRYYGREGIEKILREHMRIARELAAWIRGDPHFELAAPVRFSLVCFRFRGTDEQNRRLLDRVNATGEAFLSGAELNGRFILRLAIGNIGTAEADVEAVWRLLKRQAAS